MYFIRSHNNIVHSKTSLLKVRRASKSPQKTIPEVSARKELSSEPPPQEKPQKPSWQTFAASKGAFYFEGESLISHQYNMDVTEKQMFEISIEVTVHFCVNRS